MNTVRNRKKPPPQGGKPRAATGLLTSILEISPAAIVVIGREGQLTSANAAAGLMLGLSQDQITKGSFNVREWRATDYEGRPVPEEELPFCRVLRTGLKVENIRQAIVRPDGQRKLLSINAAPCRDQSGRVSAVVAVMEDVTERLQTEQALHSREAPYRQFFESVNDAIFLRPVTPDGLGACFAEVNGVACKWLEYTPEELRQKSRLEIDPDSTAAQIEARDKQLLAQGSAIFETRFLTKTGRRIPVEISSQLFEWGGRPMVLSIARDLTLRRAAEAALRESQHRFREMLENIPLLAVILDAEGRVQFANKSLLQLAGWTGEEVIGKDWFGGFVAPDQSRQANLVFDCIIQSRPVPFCQNEIITRSGKRRLIAWSNTVLKDSAGGIIGTASIGEDITERKRAEERLNKVNAFLLNLGYDYDRNMQALVELCGSLLEADCALYSRLESGRLYVKGRWQTPPGMPADDAAQGHVCFEVIQGPPDRALVVRHLQETFYAKTDPMVGACGLQTYWGHPVRFGGSIRGSLCAVFTRDCEPTGDDLRILGILAAAIGQDEARRQAEDDLRKSEQLYRMMASQMADILWKFDVETRRFLYISPSVQQLRGYTVEEAMAQSLEQMLTEESLALVNRMIETRLKAFQAGDHAVLTQVHEVQVIRKEDSPVWTEMATTLLVDERGRIGVIGVSRDISERKRAQEELRVREEQLRIYAAHSPAAIAMLDRDMKYLLASRRWREDYRLGDQPIVGRSHYEVFPEIPQRWIEIHKRCLAGAVEKCDEDEFRRADGTTDWIRWEIRPWHLADNSIGGIIILSENITARKHSQETLRESEARLRTFYEAAFNGIVITEHGAIVDLNSRMAELLGYEISELVGRKVVDLVAPDDRLLVQKHQAEGYELPYEHHTVRKDRSVLAVETQARHCIYSGRPMRVTAIRDITQHLKMEQQLNQLLQQQQVILDAAQSGSPWPRAASFSGTTPPIAPCMAMPSKKCVAWIRPHSMFAPKTTNGWAGNLPA